MTERAARPGPDTGPGGQARSDAVETARETPAPRQARPGITLAVILACQLMVSVDATVVNVALPNVQADLHFSVADLAWVFNAYTLVFGGLLLLGGRAGDILGKRRVFVAGVAVFTIASLLGGLAQVPSWLIAARALQGIGGAFALPSVLALIATNFPEGPSRNRALAVFATVASASLAVLDEVERTGRRGLGRPQVQVDEVGRLDGVLRVDRVAGLTE